MEQKRSCRNPSHSSGLYHLPLRERHRFPLDFSFKNAQKFPWFFFKCMNAMHISISSLFLVSHPGMLQTLPLKINFVLKFGLSYVVEWTCCYHLFFNSSTWLDIDDTSLTRTSLESSLSDSEQLSLGSVLRFLPTLLVNPILFSSLIYLVLQAVLVRSPHWGINLLLWI
jgi:hypothetical protein